MNQVCAVIISYAYSIISTILLCAAINYDSIDARTILSEFACMIA